MGHNHIEGFWKTRGKLEFSGVNTNALPFSEQPTTTGFLQGEFLHRSLPELHHGHRFLIV